MVAQEKAEWSKRDHPAPEKVIRKKVINKDSLPNLMQDKVLEMDDNYHLVSKEESIRSHFTKMVCPSPTGAFLYYRS